MVRRALVVLVVVLAMIDGLLLGEIAQQISR